MLNPEAILSRRGPLGKVWLAAHMERKLSKTQTLQADIEESVDAIVGQDMQVMALRLSGHLLLGVVRIYSRKAKYLLDDCNEALLKIKMAFRPGIVDMTEDQLTTNKNAITLQGTGAVDIDVLMPDMDWDMGAFVDQPLPAHGHHQANIADITLRNTNDDLLDMGTDPFMGPSDGIGSQDFDGDLDLGLDWGDNAAGNENFDSMSVDGSVGVGRDAVNHRDSMGDQFAMDMDGFSHRSKSRELSEGPGFGADMDVDMVDFGAVDLGDLGIDFGDVPNKTPGQTRSPSRASSPLTDVPRTPSPGAELPNGVPTPKAKRKPKEKKQIIDRVTELAEKAGRVNKDISDILTEPHFLPRSTVVMRLLEIRSDPLAHFIPTKVTPEGSFFCAAPPGLAPELAEMFLRPANSLTTKRRAASPNGSPNKRRRAASEDDVEQARRAGSIAPSVGLGSDVLGAHDGGLDFPDMGLGGDDFQFDAGDMDGRAKSAAPSALSRLSTPALDAAAFLDDTEDTYADAACPIVMFDSRPNTQVEEGQNEQVDKEVEQSNADGKGYSKNTIKALGVIRRELKPIDGEDQGDKVLSFNNMSDKASRRAAASFFFELLVLGTRDCIKVSQVAPFENIEVRAKDKLWERQRHGSMAPSRASSLAPSGVSAEDD